MHAGAGLTAALLSFSSAAAAQSEARADLPSATESGIARPAIATDFRPRVSGLLQLDIARCDVDGGGDGTTELRGGLNLRRARLGVEGEAPGRLRYAFAYDFGGSGGDKKGRITSAWLQYDGFDPLHIRAGAFAHTQGIEGASSQALFAERASPSAIVRAMTGGDGPVAVGLSAGGKRWSGSAALASEAIQSTASRRQRALSARLGVLAVDRAEMRVHVGASATSVLRAGVDETAPTVRRIRLRDRPEFRVAAARLIDTGPIAARGATAFGLELAGQARRFSAHGEYFRIGIRRSEPEVQNPSFGGWYVQAAWTILGAPRRYRVAGSTFDAPTAENGSEPTKARWDALELGVRYSRTDLDYRDGSPGEASPPGGVRGGRQRVVSLGVNWYPTINLRFQAAVQGASIDRLSPGGAESDRDTRIFSLRTQYAY